MQHERAVAYFSPTTATTTTTLVKLSFHLLLYFLGRTEFLDAAAALLAAHNRATGQSDFAPQLLGLFGSCFIAHIKM